MKALVLSSTRRGSTELGASLAKDGALGDSLRV